MQMTISEVTTRGWEIQPAGFAECQQRLTETKLLAPVAQFESLLALPLELPQLLKANTISEKVLFALNVDCRLKITKPFVVTVERHEGIVSAYVEEINEFGYGSSSGEALHDLAETLSELYFSLQDSADRLSADLSAIRLKLNEHIQLCQA
jgi:hypothetical protein